MFVGGEIRGGRARLWIGKSAAVEEQVLYPLQSEYILCGADDILLDRAHLAEHLELLLARDVGQRSEPTDPQEIFAQLPRLEDCLDLRDELREVAPQGRVALAH